MTVRATGFKALEGRRKGQWSIRINDQWRIFFEWFRHQPLLIDNPFVNPARPVRLTGVSAGLVTQIPRVGWCDVSVRSAGDG